MTGNAVLMGTNPTTFTKDRVLTDGAGRLQVSGLSGGVSQAVGANNADGVAGSGTADKAASISYQYVLNGAGTWDRQRGDANGSVVQAGLSSTFWNYAAAASGIVNTTTAVTLKAAAGASVRNYLKTLTIAHDTLGAATELAIRDGAAGTVLFRTKLQTALQSDVVLTFDPPLKGSANTLMEVVTLTASVTGGVYVNATGFTGA